MLIFPHNTSTTITSLATSASLSLSASLLNNFAAKAINSASVALNFVGTTGTNGTDYTKVGDTGTTGIQGDRGYRGDSVYLLAVGWSKTTPTLCYTITTVRDYCAPPSLTFYSNKSTIKSTSGVDTGTQLYYDSSCTALVTDISSGQLAHNVTGREITIDGGGVITIGTFESC